MIRRWLRWPHRPDRAEPSARQPATATADGLDAALRSLRALLDAPQVPAEVRERLQADYAELQAMIERLEQGLLHVAVFGRVSVGKSALLNALLGREAFTVDVLHGTTRVAGRARWQAAQGPGVELVDTPGIDELDGEERERLAFELAGRCDLLLFVVDGDLGAAESQALASVAGQGRPVLLVLNKADRLTGAEREALLTRLAERAAALPGAVRVLACAARPAAQRRLRVDVEGREHEEWLQPEPDIGALREAIVTLLESEGMALAALNAARFAGELSERVAERVAAAREHVAGQVVRGYCLTKAVAVAANPVPVADLLAAGSLDVALVVHLSRVYGLPMSQREAGALVLKISAQLAGLMGALWGTQVVFSTLKGLSAGASTVLTAASHGALAWYATRLVGDIARQYLVQGASWGPDGPRKLMRDIVARLDRDSIVREAYEALKPRLARR